MSEIGVGIVIVCILLGSFLTGIELAFGMAITGFIGYVYLVSLPAAMNLLAKDFYDTATSFGLTVIPLFVLMGQIAYNSGMASRLSRLPTNLWVMFLVAWLLQQLQVHLCF